MNKKLRIVLALGVMAGTSHLYGKQDSDDTETPAVSKKEQHKHMCGWQKLKKAWYEDQTKELTRRIKYLNEELAHVDDDNLPACRECNHHLWQQKTPEQREKHIKKNLEKLTQEKAQFEKKLKNLNKQTEKK